MTVNDTCQENGVEETHKHSDSRCAHGPPSCVRLKPRHVRKLSPIEVLGTHTLVESEVSDTDPKPCGQPASGSHAREPSENHAGAAAYSHVRKK